MNIVLASGNAHKVAELQGMATAAGLPVRFVSAKDVGGMPTVAEDTGTFEGNARKKARALWEKLGGRDWVLADDSGICVEVLAGGPGVESAYFAGPQGDPAANLQKLIQVMESVPEGKRGARFLCLLLLLSPGGDERLFHGECAGRLTFEPRGGKGFGYDPILVPAGFDQTFAELGDDVKNRISHRARAFAGFAAWWRAEIKGQAVEPK
ncbi:RdgB/HAM1 family non-canonical purine NTP pyrophosphatase [Nibricoccus sp. IMCC34717]|uniref:RdgB/HAM1 family non-canonical purine NTP pyrophosphatase n=1 Tax=Nibricoccus sp. IMCC34717 TaxID=3034021 RepID=UPI00384B2913